jgi:hypothetical protein
MRVFNHVRIDERSHRRQLQEKQSKAAQYVRLCSLHVVAIALALIVALIVVDALTSSSTLLLRLIFLLLLHNLASVGCHVCVCLRACAIGRACVRVLFRIHTLHLYYLVRGCLFI